MSQTQGTNPFQTDLKQLSSDIFSGNLAAAKKDYAAMEAKMKTHGSVPSDFAAISTALNSGDLTTAASAMQTVQTDAATQASSQFTNSQSSKPIQTDLKAAFHRYLLRDLAAKKDSAAIGTALNSGDLTTAASAMQTVQTDVANMAPPPPPPNSQSTTTSSLLSALDSSDSSSTSSSKSTLESLSPVLSPGRLPAPVPPPVLPEPWSL